MDKKEDINKCGSCTLCCRLTEVHELSKQVNQWCNHCSIGKGCKVYLSRPESCQSFKCVWLLKGLNENLRPDYSKVIFEVLSDKTFLAIVHPDYFESWKSKIVLKLIKEILHDGISIVAIIPGHQAQMFLSRDRKIESIKTELDAALEANKNRREK